jgi:hypothetical protein
VLARLEAAFAQWPEIFARLARFRAAMEADARFVVATIGAEPANTRWLEAPGADPAALRAAARAAGLALPEPQGRRFPVRANASWLAMEPGEIAARLGDALEASRR